MISGSTLIEQELGLSEKENRIALKEYVYVHAGCVRCDAAGLRI
jgi:hypothetical protein